MATIASPDLGTRFIEARLSDEQREAFESVVHRGHNTVVNAVAGSGKTRTALTSAVAWLAARPVSASHAPQYALIVAYNRMLRCDVGEQIFTHVPPQISSRVHVHTYHSLAGTYFSASFTPLAATENGGGPDGENQDASGVYDEFLDQVSTGAAQPRGALPRYGLVVIDEAQDMTPTLYKFITTFMAALPEPPQLLILGDPFQLLYDYRRATDDYMLRAQEHFGRCTVNGRRLVTDAPFTVTKLSTSFRISPEMAEWINNKLDPRTLAIQYSTFWRRNAHRITKWWGDGIRSGAPSRPNSVQTVLATRRTAKDRPDTGTLAAVDAVFKEFGDTDTVMLTVSAKNAESPARKLVAQFGDLLSVLTKGTKIGDGPRTLTTITSFKGLERDAVVLLGFDAFFEKLDQENPISLLNKFYVAATRARKKLLVVQFGTLSFATARSLDRIFHVDELTEEQRAVTAAIAIHKQNVIVNAVAGSGKTRTALTTAIEWLRQPDTNGPALLVAYNKRLEQDMTAQRDACVPSDAVHRIEIRTIHGFGYTYFGGQGLTTDRDLLCWAADHKRPTRNIPKFGLVIIDEAQDLTPELVRFLRKVISLCPKPQLLILGDPFQLLYGFKGADERFLTRAEDEFGDLVKAAPFCHLRLSICFRITHEMAAWINKELNPNNLHRAMLPDPGWFERNREEIREWWGDGIRANPLRGPEPDSVEYFRRWDHQGAMLLTTVDKIKEVFGKYDTDCSALVSPSIVSHEQSPVRLITNTLDMIGRERQAWHIDGGKVSESSRVDVRKNKRLASTIHRFKGRERDAIVLVGLDSFAEKREKTNPRNVFNMFYVGATRARKKLLIIQWQDTAYATHTSRVQGLTVDDYKPKCCPVTSALMHCAFDETLCLESPACLTSVVAHSAPASVLDRDDYIVQGSHHGHQRHTLENVASIIGVAIEIRLQLLLDDGMLRVPDMPEISSEGPNYPKSLLDFVRKMHTVARQKTDYSWAEILHFATAQLTLMDQFLARWRQTQDFESWPVAQEPHKLDSAVQNLVDLLYVPLCCGAGSSAARSARSLSFEEKISALKSLRRAGRLVLQEEIDFLMKHNRIFVERQGLTLTGIMDVVLLPQSIAAQRLRQCGQADKADKESVKAQAGEDEDVRTIIVEIKATSQVQDDHRLQIACYGAMWEEAQQSVPDNVEDEASDLAMLSQVTQVEPTSEHGEGNQEASRDEMAITSQVTQVCSESGVPPVDGEKKAARKCYPAPELYLAYPTLGELRRVFQGMESFEFLHRIGFRKLHLPFDDRVLLNSDGSEPGSPL